MNRRDAAFYASLVKLLIFTVASVIVTGTLAIVMGGFGFGDKTKYQALFTSASEIKKGDDVRVAGVSVGEVTGVEIYQRASAKVKFSVKSDVPITEASTVSIRFLNLVGNRYMSIEQGKPGAQRLKAGETIPAARTTPALNLTALFNGFQPLFQALNPADVNKLSANLIAVFQGEGGTVQQLLARTASLTSSLADRDQLIGEVVGNLSELMKTVDDRHTQLNELVTGLEQWTGKLARDRSAIGASVQSISDLTVTLSDLLTETRPLLKKDIAEIRRLFTLLNRPENRTMLNEYLEKLPSMLAKQTRIGVYGSWYNYYLCEFQGGIVLPSQIMDVLPPAVQKNISEFTLHSRAKRCS